ncbi:GNAT family N-acetyltransferase [Streptomyces sp. NPDC102415]|uniref:GNAT family N-acetyltransferase n=1 Tax=Streptomyces sp. NPDC102415 TaxID=3366173 RepID=UPI0037F18146
MRRAAWPARGSGRTRRRPARTCVESRPRARRACRHSPRRPPLSDIERSAYSSRPADHATEATDCRFGPTPADDHQDRGLGTLVLPSVMETARLLGRTRIILWGGVRDNPRAIRYYEKNGFQPVGRCTEADGSLSLDMMLDLHPVPDPARP